MIDPLQGLSTDHAVAAERGWAFCVVECACGRPRVSSRQLFPSGHTEICVEHEGLEYCLRITKQKKLILYR